MILLTSPSNPGCSFPTPQPCFWNCTGISADTCKPDQGPDLDESRSIFHSRLLFAMQDHLFSCTARRTIKYRVGTAHFSQGTWVRNPTGLKWWNCCKLSLNCPGSTVHEKFTQHSSLSRSQQKSLFWGILWDISNLHTFALFTGWILQHFLNLQLQ